MNKIIDFHNHIFPAKIAPRVVSFLTDYYGFGSNGSGEIDDLLSSAEAAGISKLIVHSTATKVSQVETINIYLREVVKAQKGDFIGFGTLHPDFDDISGELKNIISYGLRGLKFHPDFQGFEIDSDKMFRIYDTVGDALPILMHVGDKKSDSSSPKRMARAVKSFPNVTFIAAHFGGYSVWDEAYEYLAGEDLYFDTSSSLHKIPIDLAMKIIEKHGADRMLFASDYPMSNHTQSLQQFNTLPLSENERDMILYKNAEKLLTKSNFCTEHE